MIDRPIPLQRIDSAAQRLDDMRRLNDGDFPGGDAYVKHRLFQEFFFHLVGSAEFLAFYVNVERALGIADNEVHLNSWPRPSVPIHSPPLCARSTSMCEANRCPP
jgi:hypothetical protein